MKAAVIPSIVRARAGSDLLANISEVRGLCDRRLGSTALVCCRLANGLRNVIHSPGTYTLIPGPKCPRDAFPCPDHQGLHALTWSRGPSWTRWC
jgi:hypothetical protein